MFLFLKFEPVCCWRKCLLYDLFSPSSSRGFSSVSSGGKNKSKNKDLYSEEEEEHTLVHKHFSMNNTKDVDVMIEIQKSKSLPMRKKRISS